MPFGAFDPTDDQLSAQELAYKQQQAEAAIATAAPDVAQRVAAIYKDAPYIPANIVLAMAKAGVSQGAVDAVKKTAAAQAASTLENQKPKSQGWFSRNIGNKVKAASRWTFAGLQFLPDVTQNVASQIFSKNDPAGFDGWFKSTQLGSLMGDPSQAGSGFFVGGQVAEKQAERARRVRGTIDGHAWTVGRGAAEQVFSPNSKPYAILSGFLDAAVQLGADPTLIGGKALAPVKAAKALIPAVATAEELNNARLLAKGLAGLEDAEGIAFTASKFGKFITTDRRAVRMTQRIVDVAKDAGRTVEQKTLWFLENIEGIDPPTARLFAEADDEGKVLGILGEASARLANNPEDVLLPSDIREFRLGKVGSKVMDGARERVPLYRNIRNSRYFAELPKQSVVINGTGSDKAQSIKTYANYLRGIGLGDETDQFKNVMDKVVRAYSETDPAVARASLHDAYDTAVDTVIRHAMGDTVESRDFAYKVITEAKKKLADARAYNVDEIGWADDGGFIQMLRRYLPDDVFDNIPPDRWDSLVLQGPGALAELVDEVQVLPDFRRMRALTGNPFISRAVRNKAGDQRGLVTAVEFVQNEIWKPLTLATGGYMMRNMIDAQTRIAMSGGRGMFNHPMDFIQWIIGRKGGFDILGGKLDDTVGDLTKNWNGEQKAFRDALTFDLHKNLQDPINAQERMLKNGSFSVVNRGVDLEAHTTGYVDNLAILNDDSIAVKISQLRAEGLNTRQRLKAIKDWLFDGDGQSSLSELRDYFRSGIKYVDPESGKTGFIQLGDNIPDDVFVQWVDKLSNFRVNTIVRDDAELRIVHGYNKVPLTRVTKNGKTVSVPQVRMTVDNANELLISGDGAVGSIVKLDDGTEGLIIAKRAKNTGQIDPFTGKPLVNDEVVIQPVHAGSAFTSDQLGSAELRKLLNAKGDEGVLAQFVKRAERGTGGPESTGQKFLRVKDKMTDAFFVKLYGKATQKLEKSPVFRQAYYREVGRNLDLLNPAEAQTLLSRIELQAADEGVDAVKYIGDKKILANLREVAAGTSDATGTVAQLDEYAKMVALRQTKELLYNATERNNLEDIMRIVVPFGSAWKEVMGTYASAVLEDPTRIRKAQLIFEGGKKFDPDNNGEGFFYKDPTTGEYSFNFPLSATISKLLTSQETALQAPLKRISIGLGVIPSIGPVAQVAASTLLRDTPDNDFITSVLLPYGKKTGINIVPTWASRIKEAIEGNTMNMQTVYANTYIETLRALSASGEYDLSNIDEQERLYSDARGKAKIIASLRALGQFFGPTSPSPEFRIDTIKGDMYGTQLVKEFQKLQADNYDTAVSKFLEIYGNDALLYVSNKTESVAGGLEATDAFGDWERTEGKGLIAKYPDVAGFMAPAGDNFSFEVWSRQLAKGKRRRLTDREIVELAQYRAASAQYRALRDKLPATPSAEQKAWLRKWREKLNKEYPGFPVVAEFNPGEFPKKMAQLDKLVQEPKLADNDVADATRQYLDARKKAVAQYVAAGGAESGFSTAAAAAPLRDWLARIGIALKQQTPEFSRLYDRVLSNEVEQ